MGLLEKLWDDTVAGPRPDSGLGRLRKYNTFSFRSNSGGRESNGNEKSYGEEATATAPTVDIPVRVSRSITIVKPPGYTGSAPASPAGGTPPPSPFSDQEHSGFGEGPHQTRMRRQKMRLEREALLLLKMSDL